MIWYFSWPLIFGIRIRWSNSEITCEWSTTMANLSYSIPPSWLTGTRYKVTNNWIPNSGTRTKVAFTARLERKETYRRRKYFSERHPFPIAIKGYTESMCNWHWHDSTRGVTRTKWCARHERQVGTQALESSWYLAFPVDKIYAKIRNMPIWIN